MAEQNVNLVITAVDQATRVLQGVGASIGNLEKSYGSFVRLARGAGPIAAVALGSLKLASATIDAERASNRLNAALKATGYSAGITRAELDELSESLKRSTIYDDDEIRKGISALLRFRDVQGDVFRQAAQLAPDLAAALDTDVVGAFTRLGRALEDPEKGLRALREAGLNVSSAQDQVNKVMKETGDVAAAQKIILDELAKSIGGAAAGEKTGIYGSLKTTGQALDDFFKGWGQKIKQVVEESENASRRLSRIAGWPAAALGALTPGVAQAGPTAGQRADALSGAGQQESARLIAQTQAMVDKEVERIQRETAEREKRLREEDIKSWVAYAEQVFKEADEMNLALAKISEEHWAREEKLRQEDIKGWVAYAEQVFEEADETNRALARIADEEAERARKAVERLGFTFASAFEEAIVKLNSLREILRGLAEDVLRYFVRTTVTEPLAGFFTSLFTGGGSVNDITPSASGGHRSAGQMLLVGEQGPELFVPDRAGTVIPNHALGGGPSFFVDMRGASVEAVDRLESMVRRLDGTLEQRSVAAVYDANARGARV